MMKKIFFAVVIFLLTLNASNIDRQIKTQQKNQSDMKKKIQQYNAIARQKSKESKTLLSQLSRLRQNANESASKMNDLERENSRLQLSVSELSKDIARVNESIRRIIAILRERLTELYKFTPNENSIPLIFASSGAHEAVNTAYMLNMFARQDIEMFAELNARERELNEAKTKLEADKSKIASQTDELRKKREEFNTTIKKTDTLLRNVQSEQKKAEAAAKELEAAQRAVGSKINSLMKQKKTAQTKKTQTAKSNSKSQPAKTSSSSNTSTSAVKTLSWPVNGTVTVQYGSRVHPVFKTKVFNSGIDIKAASGTAVKAAGPGEVLYQGWLRGFGQVVIIDHGGDLSTVYAHLGGASVREGSVVKTGTVIGRVGNSGTDSEYGLHFEVRK
ncbi:MAG: peptidoglycan DD-metalloendopeptidase family protein, partial [Synergistaceae bacterium]|nr:peptidoglycan DD-metalloendopeptidase family protein [Synergistaceae bacterium]